MDGTPTGGVTPREPAHASPAGATSRAIAPLHIAMSGRDPSEPHRAATPLELLFDLCFVVAVAFAAAALHHDLAEGEIAHGVVAYLLVFFTIWWPWMNFTWFASAYDTDDVLYRLLTFVQIAGVLVVAAGVPRIFEDLDFSVAVVGYVIMRSALVAQWLRAWREDPAGRPVALRFALGVGLVQLLWVVRLAAPGAIGVALLLVLLAVELLIPVWAEGAGRPTPWHPRHIAERYGLFTIIVLGECVLAATTAVQSAFAAAGASPALVAIAAGGLLLVLGVWWAYFKLPAALSHELAFRWQIAWGYGHYVIFAAVAAIGAGLQVAVDSVLDPLHAVPVVAGLSVAVPTAVVLVAIGVLHHGAGIASDALMLAVAVGLLVGAGLMAGVVGAPASVIASGLVVAAVVGRSVAALRRAAIPA